MKLTQKQELFVLRYIELGNASEAYRRAYSAAKMKSATVNRKATELLANGTITARIAELRGKVVEKVVLDRAWVIERLMRNARIAMGEERIKVAIRPKSAPDTVVELEITERDAAAANRALELLGKADEVGLFREQPAKDLIQPSESPRSTGAEHLRELSQRYADALAKYKGEDGEDHMDPITRRFRNAAKAIEAGRLPSAGHDHLAELSKRYQSRGGTAAPAAKPSSQAASSDSEA